MTSNPLIARRNEPHFAGPTYGTQAWCDWRNEQISRPGMAWVVDGNGGCRLQDTGTDARPQWLTRRREAERRDWMHRQKYPAAAVPP